MSDPKWLDGKGLVEWLESRGLELTKPVLGSMEKSVRRWRGGAVCSVYSADQLLTKLDVHLHELPDELWVEHCPNRNYYPDVVKTQAVRRVSAGGESVKKVAGSLGCDPKTIRNWIEAGVFDG